MSIERDVTVLIPVWNDPAGIDMCLAALRRQTVPRDRFEIVVVDNGSTDDTVARIRANHPDVTVLSELRPGSYAARNTGIAATTGRWIAFTDADCVPEPGWLAAALAAGEAEARPGVLGGRVDLFEPAGAEPGVAAFDSLFAGFDQRRNIAAGKCITANWMSPRDVLTSVGGFNADLKSTGDAEMAGRLRAAGWDIRYVDDMTVRHPTRTSTESIVRKHRRVVGGRWQKEGDRIGTARWVRIYARQFAGQLAKIARSSLSPSRKLGAARVSLAVLRASLSELRRLTQGGDPSRG